MATRTLPIKPKSEDMEVTPERALRIKLALLKQWEDQNNVVVSGWEEIPKDSNEPIKKYKVTSRFPTYEAIEV